MKFVKFPILSSPIVEIARLYRLGHANHSRLIAGSISSRISYRDFPFVSMVSIPDQATSQHLSVCSTEIGIENSRYVDPSRTGRKTCKMRDIFDFSMLELVGSPLLPLFIPPNQPKSLKTFSKTHSPPRIHALHYGTVLYPLCWLPTTFDCSGRINKTKCVRTFESTFFCSQ